ncbi:hypothetical protein [uncultured Bacteroides sp.]|uniref:hypothetical protein n=1 Tax=uncultured Bacteroides sp. TaxID=162156 RepID=UPI00262FCDB2|nr:hypothetical protein [uncultured Bacteroides sp.]
MVTTGQGGFVVSGKSIVCKTDVFLPLLVVPETVLFSNEFMADLERIWALRYYIPDPTRPDYSENI